MMNLVEEAKVLQEAMKPTGFHPMSGEASKQLGDFIVALAEHIEQLERQINALKD